MPSNAETRTRTPIRAAAPKLLRLIAVACLALLAIPAQAHVGSPDIYADGNAGPYRLFVTIRPPQVIPGVAEIEVRTQSSDTVTSIDIAPIPLTGEASLHPPVADPMKHSGLDQQSFTGALWIMASGSWQVRFRVTGSQGTGVLSIPVPATSSATKGMQAGLGILLGGFGLLLVVGIIGIVGAAVRDAQLAPGAKPSPSSRKRALVAMSVTFAVMTGALVFGNLWWKVEASNYAKYVYKPLTMQASLRADNTLDLKIEDPGWLKSRKTSDFVLDHQHLMHLYLLRQPGLERVYHLHPDQVAPGEFTLALPSIPSGSYHLYADVVHETGFPETMVATIDLPGITGRQLAGDDALGTANPLSSLRALGNTCPVPTVAGPTFQLPDGYSMVWNNPALQPAKTPQLFQFSLLDPSGKAPVDTSLYMGMLGHAAFVKNDGTVFAHVHPSGTVSMAALMMAAKQNSPGPQTKPEAMANMPGMVIAETSSSSTTTALPNAVAFPYGFPTPGAYRIFVQMKHGTTIETATFDACSE